MTGPGAIEDFAGTWRLTRVIQDQRAGQTLHADGHATLCPGLDGYIYEEDVTLRIPGQAPMRGTRRYLWRAAPGRIEIRFQDGRHFHDFALGQSAPQDHHDCPPDSYDAAYDFANWPRWSVRWTVKGPRKSYAMLTDYVRAG